MTSKAQEEGEVRDEKRKRTRVHVTTDIDVSGASGLHRAVLIDLSRAGARFLSEKNVGAVGDTVELFLPNPGAQDIGVVAEILRRQESPEGEVVAVRFSFVEPAKRQALEGLLGILLRGGGGGRRRAPRIAHRIEITFGSARRATALLEDISRGGAALMIADALALGDSVDLCVCDSAGDELLLFHAKVVSHRSTAKEGSPPFRVGLAFGAVRPERQACLDALLRYYSEH